MSAEEFKRRRDIIEKGISANTKNESQLKKRAKNSIEQINMLKKRKNVGQFSFEDELEQIGRLN